MRRQGVRPRGRGSPVAHAHNRACGKDRIERYIEQWHIGRIPNI
ncbi:transcriptional regulator, AraC family domain protein [Burkholderia mallei]|nr:transcriptional regulator, AraC family domain protein [Burkholderia mallei]KOT19963.1 transcriptional regulator, AraC family domain protein [Burkholderia mallei]